MHQLSKTRLSRRTFLSATGGVAAALAISGPVRAFEGLSSPQGGSISRGLKDWNVMSAASDGRKTWAVVERDGLTGVAELQPARRSLKANLLADRFPQGSYGGALFTQNGSVVLGGAVDRVIGQTTHAPGLLDLIDNDPDAILTMSPEELMGFDEPIDEVRTEAAVFGIEGGAITLDQLPGNQDRYSEVVGGLMGQSGVMTLLVASGGDNEASFGNRVSVVRVDSDGSATVARTFDELGESGPHRLLPVGSVPTAVVSSELAGNVVTNLDTGASAPIPGVVESVAVAGSAVVLELASGEVKKVDAKSATVQQPRLRHSGAGGAIDTGAAGIPIIGTDQSLQGNAASGYEITK